MKLPEIKKMAQKLGINVGTLKKPDIIKKIQVKEGNDPCFDSGKKTCEQMDCLWRDDCIK
ncbi:MAG: hypothetical protein JXB88_27190 [Spirochaetales bacterium]|nr:hypothetical protein [Spirochaetales bacterium]